MSPTHTTTPLGSGPSSLRQRLQSRVDFEIGSWVWTCNRSTFLSCRPVAGPAARRWAVRIDRCFEGAGDEVVAALADYLNGRSSRSQRLAALATLRAEFSSRPAPAIEVPSGSVRSPPRSRAVAAAGRHHDLQRLLEVVRRHRVFAGHRIDDVHALWGRWGPKGAAARRQRTVQLGSFVDAQRLIRVHPVLDHREVPEAVVRSVLFHELLHAIVPAERRGSRRQVHTARFRVLERLDPDGRAAERWIGRSLFPLLRRGARSGHR
ncbi:MAG: M48 family peptidase [Acidobacteria bacterium]|nr:MAG: M48 family peptidase [Acidobacteriota bacterium]